MLALFSYVGCSGFATTPLAARAQAPLIHGPANFCREGRSAVGSVTCMVSAPPKQGGFMAKVKEINEGNKMKSMKKEPPKVRGVRLPPQIKSDITSKFKKQYAEKDLEILWGALIKCYGNAQLAEEAARANPQILNPSYTFCNTMLVSKDVLFNMMGKEEAMDVMLKNPAVLQCGPSLDTLGPDEIKGFANIRSLGNRIPEQARGVILSVTIALVLFPLAAVRIPGLEDSAALNIIKPLVGILFSIAIEGSRIVIVGTIAKAKLAGDERIKIAEENERRRMGGKKKIGR